MDTQEIVGRHFYAATSDELGAIADEPVNHLRLGLQNELGVKVASESSGGQGYTDAATFRAIMTGNPFGAKLPARRTAHDQYSQFFESLESFRYAAGEPHAYPTRSLGYMGIVLESEHATFPGESLAYSLRTLSGQSVERQEHGERFWGQALLYYWQAGVRSDGLNLGWTFTHAGEVGVIERSKALSLPIVRAKPSGYFTDLIGMPAIRQHYLAKESPYLDRLPQLFAEVQQEVGKLALVVPGNAYPPTNER